MSTALTTETRETEPALNQFSPNPILLQEPSTAQPSPPASSAQALVGNASVARAEAFSASAPQPDVFKFHSAYGNAAVAAATEAGQLEKSFGPLSNSPTTPPQQPLEAPAAVEVSPALPSVIEDQSSGATAAPAAAAAPSIETERQGPEATVEEVAATEPAVSEPVAGGADWAGDSLLAGLPDMGETSTTPTGGPGAFGATPSAGGAAAAVEPEPEASAMAEGVATAVAGTEAPGGSEPSGGGDAGGGEGGSEAGAPAGEGSTAVLDTSSSGGLFDSLVSVAPSSFVEMLGQARSAAPTVQQQELDQLESEFPTIEQPTGLPTQAEPPEGEAPPLDEGTAPETPPATGSEAPLPAVETDVTTGPLPASDVRTTASEPVAAEEEEGSWWDWLFDAVKRFVSQLPTVDFGLSTSAGERPQVDLSGDSDPARMKRHEEASFAEVQTGRVQADAATNADFGEHNIYPTIPTEMMRPSTVVGPPPGSKSGVAEAAPLTGEYRAALDQGAAGFVKQQVEAQAAVYKQGQATYEEQSLAIREEGQRQLDAETERTITEQVTIQTSTEALVTGQREIWREQNRLIEEQVKAQSEVQRQQTEQQVETHVRTTDTQVDDALTDAEGRAEAERVKTETSAVDLKRDAENKPRSFWDSIRGAVSDFFDSVRDAINGLFDLLRQAVELIISAAKALVRGIIELARIFVVGLIQGFGLLLKGLVTIALVAFPDTATAACEFIDGQVNGAVTAVNEAAEVLKNAADTVLTWIGDSLLFALDVMQAAFLFALDVLEFVSGVLITMMQLLYDFQSFWESMRPTIEAIVALINDPTPVIEAIKEWIGGMVAQVPGLARSITTQAITFSDPPPDHLDGIMRHLEPKIDFLLANWWQVLVDTAWLLIWPFGKDASGERPLFKSCEELYNTVGSFFSHVAELEISKATDDFLKVIQLCVEIVGMFYGWIFIGLVIAYGIIGGIGGTAAGGVGAIPGALAGMGAGAAVAAEIGYVLLIAAIASEGAILAKSGVNLVFVNETEEENEEDYERIASSGLSLAMMAVMAALSELAARLVRAIARRVVGLFRRKKPTTPTARERLDARKRAKAEADELAAIDEGIKKLDDDIAKGKKSVPKEDLDWINADPTGRRKQLAYDPATKLYRANEARAALAAEEAGILPKPVRRTTDPANDFVDGSGKGWNHKGTGPGETVAQAADTVVANARAGTNVLADQAGMSAAQRALVRAKVASDLARTPGHGEVRFVPSTPSPAVIAGGTAGEGIADRAPGEEEEEEEE